MLLFVVWVDEPLTEGGGGGGEAPFSLRVFREARLFSLITLPAGLAQPGCPSD